MQVSAPDVPLNPTNFAPVLGAIALGALILIGSAVAATLGWLATRDRRIEG